RFDQRQPLVAALRRHRLRVSPKLVEALFGYHSPLTRPFGPPSPRFAGRGISRESPSPACGRGCREAAGEGRPPIAKASSDPIAIAVAATATALQPGRSSSVGTVGFGGRLYSRGSPRTRKNA